MPLYPFQEKAVEFLVGRKHACLADDQGLGKTISAAVAAKRLGVQSLAVVAPSVALWNWQRELWKWAQLEAYVVDSSKSARQKPPVRTRSSAAIITSHALVLSSDVREVLRNKSLLIVDESQFFMRKSEVQESQRAKRLYRSLVPDVGRAWYLTGTPAPNGYACELWSMLNASMPKVFTESYKAFRRRYCLLKSTPYGDGLKPFANQRMGELRKRMDGFMLRRLKKDELDLPPRRVETVSVRPTKMPPGLEELERKMRSRMQYQMRKKVLADPKAKRDAIEAHGEVASAETPEDAFRAMRSHEQGSRFRRLSGVAKAEPAVELVMNEFENGLDAIVLFAHHKEVISTLYDGLKKHRPVLITGGMNAREKFAAVESFQNGRANVAIVQIEAGGTAITLTRACEALFVELSYTPGDNMQCSDRIYRIGQTRPVRTRFLSLAHSVDEIMVDVVRNKVAMMQELLA